MRDQGPPVDLHDATAKQGSADVGGQAIVHEPLKFQASPCPMADVGPQGKRGHQQQASAQ
ncbi:hypothetical protein K523DRAFT_325492 [Schizophyllum commune Tattone D]|nr:hypothetical protein K523DRAFT_325492 [Schizophyllum commune Tattone D]